MPPCMHAILLPLLSASCSPALSGSWSKQSPLANPNPAALRRCGYWSLHARLAGQRAQVEPSVGTAPVCSDGFRLAVVALHMAVSPFLQRRYIFSVFEISYSILNQFTFLLFFCAALYLANSFWKFLPSGASTCFPRGTPRYMPSGLKGPHLATCRSFDYEKWNHA